MKMSAGNHQTYLFSWKIENYSMCQQKNGESISSPLFIFENLNYSKWYLKVFPYGENSDSSEYLSIYLFRDNDADDKEVIIDYKINVTDGKGEVVDSLVGENKSFMGKQSHGADKFIKCERLSTDTWTKDVLTVTCEISCEVANKVILSGCVAKTKIRFDQYYFEWNIDLDNCSNWKGYFQSGFVRMPLYAVFSTSEDEIEIKTNQYEWVANPFHFCLRFSLLDKYRKEVLTKKFKGKLYSSLYYESLKIPSFFSKSQLKEKRNIYLNANKFTLKCQVTISSGEITSNIVRLNHYTSPTNLFSALQKDLQDILTDKKHCDVKLRVGDDVIPAHKILLAARSPVFSAMFEQDMLENKTGIVDIEDIDADTVKLFLEFIYTGSLNGLDYESASKLLLVGNKYQVLSLKDGCSFFLKSVLSVDKVCDVLGLADMVDHTELKKSAMDYIKENYTEVMSRPEWSKYVETNCKLASDIIIAISECIKNTN